jgi:hypothetical protein
MIFREMSRKIKTASRAAAEEVIKVRGRTIRSQALNGQSIKVFLLLSLSLSLPPYFPLSCRCCLSTLHRRALWPACSIVHPPLLRYGVAPSHKARKVPIGDVLAAPAEPDAPRDIPTANQVIDRAEWAVPR